MSVFAVYCLLEVSKLTPTKAPSFFAEGVNSACGSVDHPGSSFRLKHGTDAPLSAGQVKAKTTFCRTVIPLKSMHFIPNAIGLTSAEDLLVWVYGFKGFCV